MKKIILPKNGSEIKIHMPKLGKFPSKNITIKYDSKNFRFDIYSGYKKSGHIGEKEVISNIENKLYILKTNTMPKSKTYTITRC